MIAVEARTVDCCAGSCIAALSGPDTQVFCTGFGVPWSEGASTDCAVVFTRSAAHFGGTTPLSVSAS